MARNFNGTTDRLDYTNVVDPTTGALTIAAYVVADALAHNSFIWMAHNATDNGMSVVFFVDSAGALNLSCFTSGTAYNIKSANGAVSTGTGYRLAATWTGALTAGAGHVFINGSNVDSAETTGTGTLVAGMGKWSIGGRIYDDARNWDGRLADIGFANRVWTAGELTANGVGSSPFSISNGLLFAPPFAANTYNDPISAQAGTADGTSDYTHPNTYFPGVYRGMLERRAVA